MSISPSKHDVGIRRFRVEFGASKTKRYKGILKSVRNRRGKKAALKLHKNVMKRESLPANTNRYWKDVGGMSLFRSGTKK